MRIFILNPSTPEKLYPFSLLRNYAEFRIGLYTIVERYQFYLQSEIELIHDISGLTTISEEIGLFINAKFVPEKLLLKEIADLNNHHAILHGQEIIAIQLRVNEFKGFNSATYSNILYDQKLTEIYPLENPSDLLRINNLFLNNDILDDCLTNPSDDLIKNNFIHGGGVLNVHPTAIMKNVFVNTDVGSVYVGKNCHIMEGACLRGPVAVLDNAVVKMGAKIYGSTIIGKKCVVGGEIKSSIFFDYSNKAHDGYIGDSVIGSWCNLGAGTSCSNLKNNAGEIHIWNPLLQQKISVGNKFGVIIGDHTRTAINTSLNSGTVTGVCCNIVKAGFPPKYIPDFTWNVETGESYHKTKMLDDINSWMEMKNEKLEEKDKRLLLQHYHNRLNTNA
jgi:UDP-N-acetylglucosamine diphosphorylase/glucosamine-1-phosphate N-acetyltransferase